MNPILLGNLMLVFETILFVGLFIFGVKIVHDDVERVASEKARKQREKEQHEFFERIQKFKF